MMGTIFSVTEASRCTPPRKMMPQMMTSATPTIQEGMPKAVWKHSPMELDCTMQPMKPSARMMATAKKGGKELAEAALERGGDVIDRAAVNGAVRRPDAGLDGQRGLCINGGHAEEGDDPHPENRAGAAGQDGAGKRLQCCRYPPERR